MSKDRSKNFLDNLAYYCVSAVSLLLPLFFSKWTPDIFEFNKQYLLYFFVLVGLLGTVLKAVLEKKIEWIRTPLDIPLLVLLGITLISSLISSDRYVSFWGDLSSVTYGFVPLLFYVAFYFLAVNNLQTLKRIQTNFVLLSTSTVIATLYFILKFFKAQLGVGLPAWNPVSSLSTLFGLLLSVVLIIALGNLMIKRDGMSHYVFWLPVLVLTFLAHMMIGFRSVWVGLAVALVLLLVFAISKLEEMKVAWISVTFGIIVVAVVFAFLGTPRFITAPLPAEISLSNSTSWGITRDTLANNFKHFLFGSGPATFVYDFSQERGEDFNTSIVWNTRFLHPFSNFAELVATTGILGMIAFSIVILIALGSAFVSWFKLPFWGGKRGLLEGAKELLSHGGGEGSVYFLVLTGWLLLFAYMFLTVFGTVHWWLFFFLSAVLFALPFETSGVSVKRLSLKTSPQYSLVSSFITILVFIGVTILGIFLGRFYVAEVFAKNAAGSADPDSVIQSFTKAVSSSPSRYQYHLRLAEGYIFKASQEIGKSSPDSNLVARLVAQGVNEARTATTLSPQSVSTWEFLATMYNNARALTGEALRFQIEALEKAIALEPTNPVLQMNLGHAKLGAGNTPEARDRYKESVRLKQNFVPGYVALSLLEERDGNVTQALEYMSAAASIAPNDAVNVFNLGRLYYNRARGDDLKRAEQLFLLAVQLNPNYADGLWSLGLLNERRGDKAEALRYFRRVQSLNSDNVDIRAKIQSLVGSSE